MVISIHRAPVCACIAFSIALSVSSAPAVADDLSNAELKQISFRIVKNSNGWFRVLKSGAMAAMTMHDVYSLGLDAEAAMGEFSRSVVIDAKNDTMQLVTDVGTLGSYVATDVAAPILESGYNYTTSTVMPAVGSAASSTFEYTRDTIVPKTGELAVGAYNGAPG